MRRLLIVYNPRSSKYRLVEKEVLGEARKLKGWTVGRYEVRPTDVDDNAKRLAKLIREGDVVVCAGGDGTATVGLNAAMLSKKKVVFAALPYGNFNDAAQVAGGGRLAEVVRKAANKEVVEAWPLEAVVDGRHWRYALGYITIGMFAESTEIFDRQKVRKRLRKGKSKVYAWRMLAKWYFLNRKREFLPKFRLNGEYVVKNTTDYIAVNGEKVGGAIKGGKWYLDKKNFLGFYGRMRAIFGLFWFMVRGMLVGVKGRETAKDVIEFDEPAEVEIHAEGEYERLENVVRIEVKKAERSVFIPTTT